MWSTSIGLYVCWFEGLRTPGARLTHELWPMVSLETKEYMVDPCPGLYWCRACYFSIAGKRPSHKLKFSEGLAEFAPPPEDHMVSRNHM